MKYLISTSITLYIFIACGSSKEEDNLQVSNAQKVSEINLSAENYLLNVDKSTVTWIGSKPAGKHNGIIPIKTGTIAISNSTIVGGKMIMDVNAIQTIDLIDEPERNKRLINHLKSDDFFDTDNYPEAIFEITATNPYLPKQDMEVKQEFESDYQPASVTDHMVEAPTHFITGNLTLRDTTLSITFPANISFDNKIVTAIAKFNIDRTNWNLKYRNEASAADKTKDRFIYNTVNVGFDIVAEIENQ